MGERGSKEGRLPGRHERKERVGGGSTLQGCRSFAAMRAVGVCCQFSLPEESRKWCAPSYLSSGAVHLCLISPRRHPRHPSSAPHHRRPLLVVYGLLSVL